jgi:hypothetical protein
VAPSGLRVPTAFIQINLSHSNFADIEGEGETEITPPGTAGNQIAAPVFVDPAAGDYRETASSPTKFAGDPAVVLPGETDLAGNPRAVTCQGTSLVDIGAYQLGECPPPTAPPAGSTGGDSSGGEEKKGDGPPAPAPGATKPILSKLTLKPAKFNVTGKPPKGTAISFTLSAAASVKLEVLEKKPGKGKKRKTVALGTLPVARGQAGANSVKFSGRLKGKLLDPGKYLLRATATAGSFSSAPQTRPFEVLASAG